MCTHASKHSCFHMHVLSNMHVHVCMLGVWVEYMYMCVHAHVNMLSIHHITPVCIHTYIFTSTNHTCCTCVYTNMSIHHSHACNMFVHVFCVYLSALLCLYLYCIDEHTAPCMYSCIHMHTHTHMHTQSHIYIHVYIYVSMLVNFCV